MSFALDKSAVTQFIVDSNSQTIWVWINTTGKSTYLPWQKYLAKSYEMTSQSRNPIASTSGNVILWCAKSHELGIYSNQVTHCVGHAMAVNHSGMAIWYTFHCESVLRILLFVRIVNCSEFNGLLLKIYFLTCILSFLSTSSKNEQIEKSALYTNAIIRSHNILLQI